MFIQTHLIYLDRDTNHRKGTCRYLRMDIRPISSRPFHDDNFVSSDRDSNIYLGFHLVTSISLLPFPMPRNLVLTDCNATAAVYRKPFIIQKCGRLFVLRYLVYSDRVKNTLHRVKRWDILFSQFFLTTAELLKSF